MKKIGLVIILCAGFLKGMEAGHFPLGNPFLEQLPKEVKTIVITALNTYDNADDVIEVIKEMSLTNKELNKIVNEMYGNQESFTALVHILADKFGISPVLIALWFNTPASKEYIRLFNSLMSAIESNDVDKVIQLINQKTDVNAFSSFSDRPLPYAIKRRNSIILELLLNAGANPNVEFCYFSTVKNYHCCGAALDYIQEEGASAEIIQLLKKYGAKKSSELKK